MLHGHKRSKTLQLVFLLSDVSSYFYGFSLQDIKLSSFLGFVIYFYFFHINELHNTLTQIGFENWLLINI